MALRVPDGVLAARSMNTDPRPRSSYSLLDNHRVHDYAHGQPAEYADGDKLWDTRSFIDFVKYLIVPTIINLVVTVFISMKLYGVKNEVPNKRARKVT